jgi:hypothetical protein
MPLLHRNLRALEIEDPYVGRLRGIYRHTWSRNQLLLERLSVALDALADGAVEPLALGGPPRALRYYEDAGLRPIDLLELLLRPQQRARGLALLGELGWKPAREDADFRDGPAHLVGRDSRLVARTRGLADSGTPGTPLTETAWKTAEELDLKGRRARVLSPSADFLSIVLDGAVGRQRRNIQWVADALFLLRTAHSEIDWQLVLREALANSLALRLRDALDYIATVVDAPVPDSIRVELGETPTNRQEALAHRLSGVSGVVAGEFPRTAARYLRMNPDGGPIPMLMGFPAFLATTWGLRSVWHVPVTALSKAAAGVRRRLTASARPRARS